MSDLGQLNYFLGIIVTRNASGMFPSQRKYSYEILKCTHMVCCNPCRTPIDTKSNLGADCDRVSDLNLSHSIASALKYLNL